MKAIRLTIPFILGGAFLVFALLTCTKEGAVGPKGFDGIVGQKGEVGGRGANGARGAKGERGDAGPKGAKGSNGDQGDTGNTGLPGDKGAKGNSGDAGPQGPAGPQGLEGTRGIGNVIYSEWIDPTPLPSVNGRIEISAPKLTQTILETGEVYVYLRYRNDPEAQVYLVDGFTHSYWQFRCILQEQKITVETTELLASNSDFPSNMLVFTAMLKNAALNKQELNPIMRYEYRYVLIPGGTIAEPMASTNAITGKPTILTNCIQR